MMRLGLPSCRQTKVLNQRLRVMPFSAPSFAEDDEPEFISHSELLKRRKLTHQKTKSKEVRASLRALVACLVAWPLPESDSVQVFAAALALAKEEEDSGSVSVALWAFPVLIPARSWLYAGRRSAELLTRWSAGVRSSAGRASAAATAATAS